MPTLNVIARIWNDAPIAPWPLAPVATGQEVRLWGGMSDDTIGLIAAEFASRTGLDSGLSAQALIEQITNVEYVVLDGGVQARDGETVISPGCCCGPEGWREWFGLLEDPLQRPWGGHGEAMWVEPTPAGFDVKRGPDQEPGTPPIVEAVIPFTRAEMTREVGAIAEDMAGFLTRRSEWAHALAPSAASDFVKVIDYWLDISAAPPPHR